MTYKEFKALSDAYWLGWNNAQGTLDKDEVSHRSFLTLIQNIMMDEMRLADVVERKQGKNISKDGFLCSVCKFGDFGGFHGYKPNYCPNCGAKMEVR